jgi:hypothetical protein
MGTISNNPKETTEAKPLSCNLTTPELQLRKSTVILALKSQVIERKELQNGYCYKFIGSDEVLDELTSFIKTERMCCDFFNFSVTVTGDGSATWLEITGPGGVKGFIETEIQL